MPDLGKYADTVLSAYGVSLALLVALIAVTLWRGARVKAALAQVEARRAKPSAPPAGAAKMAETKVSQANKQGGTDG